MKEHTMDQANQPVSQMWVNMEDWQENPEIIHTKFN